MTTEVLTGIYIGVGIFIVTSILTGVFFLIKFSIRKCLNNITDKMDDVSDRVNHLTLCSFAMFDAFQEQGINGPIKKEMNRLKEQVVKN